MRRIRWTSLLSAALTAAAIFGWSPALQAQTTGSATGIVVDAETGFPLSGATVVIEGTSFSALTNQQGRFALLNLPAGEHVARVAYLGYSELSQTLTIVGGQVTELRLEVAAAALEVEGFTVTGQRRGQAAALNQQLTAANVTNVVAADQIGRFPDSNVGDALKRIPGVSVIWDQGEARFGLIRGTEPRLNSVMINGERIPSAEAEVREVQLDLIPSDMVSAVEVNKTLTPDMDADAIGGAVNIVTRAAPTDRRISATLGSGYNFLAEKPMSIASGVFADRFGGDQQFGLVLSGSFFDHRLGSDNIEAAWDEADGFGPFVTEMDIRRYDIQRTRRSLSAAFDWELDERNTITLRGIYNHRDDWENRYRLRSKLEDIGANGVGEYEIRRQTKGGTPDVKNRRLEDQRTQSYSLTGDHLLGAANVNWNVQWAQASEERPNERYIEWRVRRIDGVGDLSDPSRPMLSALNPAEVALDQFELREITEQYGYTRDRDLNGRLDIELPLSEGRSNVKFGARYRSKTKLRDNNFFEYEPLSGFNSLVGNSRDYSDAGFLPGSQYQAGNFFPEDELGRLDLTGGGFDETDLPEEYAAGNFNADESIFGGYAMLTQQLGAATSLIAGLRVERTSVDYTGNQFVEDDESVSPVTGSQSYVNLFPNVQLRHELDDRTVLRAAFTSTMARPNYYDLVPYRVVNLEDNELSLGNPELDPTRSLNLDVMAERYFSSVGLVSAGVFYKDISDFIFEYTQRDFTDPTTGGFFRRASRPENGAGATLLGFEVAFQRQLDFFGPWGRFMGLYANYTFTDSSIDGLPIDGRENEDLPLPGTSKHTLNASLSFDTERASIRGSMNLQDDFIDPGEVGDSAFYDRYYDRQITVDANASFQVSPTLQFFIEANNLTNQPLRYYQGISSRLMQEEFYSRRFQAGLKYDLR
jgi:TonB-dependent receptor